jgi:hypothetical protein
MPSIIDDSTSNDVLFPKIDGHRVGHGFDPAQIEPDAFRPLFGDHPDQMKVIPKSNWSAIIKEKDAKKSSLYHRRQVAANGQQMPTLDQNGQGYCWAYSTTRCVMYLRSLSNLPYKRLSAHAIGCMVKGFQDEGGWCGLSAKFLREKGVPDVGAWPEKSMARANDKPEVWENAAGNVVTEDWLDVAKHVADQNLTFDQIATCLLLDIPVALDFSWWGHSVCGIELVEVEAGSFGIRIDNSWSDQWEDRGSSILRGQKAVPMGAVALRVSKGA